ncbi:hypothetical protein F7731_23875 [Cytobacillus depressus]|uniref:Uncharacterized protein n=1 Tax=Cytobacillus depressus TaxID=1602942 RepID=A0A6L3UY06_9BACI|nr:hypothetical protein [Cytobacillus depressus]KAB2328992.1 hypothetical protein F7731_23875 [Cytobacillus depressus]
MIYPCSLRGNKLFLFLCFIITLMLSACTVEKSSKIPEFKEQYFEGKSNNWYVMLESKQDNIRNYSISYIGEGSKPPTFEYEIYESSDDITSGVGYLETQDEFDIGINCGGPCRALPKKIPVVIQWEGKKEEMMLKISYKK